MLRGKLSDFLKGKICVLKILWQNRQEKQASKLFSNNLRIPVLQQGVKLTRWWESICWGKIILPLWTEMHRFSLMCVSTLDDHIGRFFFYSCFLVKIRSSLPLLSAMQKCFLVTKVIICFQHLPILLLTQYTADACLL